MCYTTTIMHISSVIAYGMVAIIIAAIIWFEVKSGTLHNSLSKFKLPGTYLNQYTIDFTALALEHRIDPVIARDDEIRRLTQVLARREKNNALLVGDAGVGKTAIVEGLAVKIVERTVPEALFNKRVLSLDVAALISGTKYRGEFEQRAKKIIEEIIALHRSVILFVDEAHSILEAQGSEGSINLSDMLKPALARGDLQMIGATTGTEYNKYFKTEPSLERRFQTIEVLEPTAKETIMILHGVKDKYREYHKVEFTDAALTVAVELSRKIIHGRRLPDKAIDAIDEAAAMVKVAHLSPALNSVLFQAALKKHPAATRAWGAIQTLDRKIITARGTGKNVLVKQREEAEDRLRRVGVVVVDSSDIEDIIKEWAD